MMRLAIVYLTGGKVSGGGLKTMQYLVPLLQQDSRVRESRIFVPARMAAMPALAGRELECWPRWDWTRGYAWLKRAVLDFDPDVVYIPTAAWVDLGSVPVVVMCRNMEALTRPLKGHAILAGLKNLLRRHVARAACRQGTRIIAVSEYVRQSLVAKRIAPADKISVVYHGVEPPLAPSETTRPAALAGRNGERFLFTAGSVVPYRGLEDVFHALPLLTGHPGAGTLLIGGAAIPGVTKYARRLRSLAEKLGIASRLVWLGHIGPKEMSWCFNQCEAFIMTSRVEACPNLVLEALNHGCLNVATSLGPMPEIFGEAATYYEAGSAVQLAERISDILTAPAATKDRRRQIARRRGSHFTWDAAATGTLMELERAIEQSDKDAICGGG